MIKLRRYLDYLQEDFMRNLRYNFHNYWTNGHDVTSGFNFLKRRTVICLSTHLECGVPLSVSDMRALEHNRKDPKCQISFKSCFLK